MAANRRVFDSHHLQADCQEARTGISSGTLCSEIKYGLPLPFYIRRDIMCKHDVINIQHAHCGRVGSDRKK